MFCFCSPSIRSVRRETFGWTERVSGTRLLCVLRLCTHLQGQQQCQARGGPLVHSVHDATFVLVLLDRREEVEPFVAAGVHFDRVHRAGAAHSWCSLGGDTLLGTAMQGRQAPLRVNVRANETGRLRGIGSNVRAALTVGSSGPRTRTLRKDCPFSCGAACGTKTFAALFPPDRPRRCTTICSFVRIN